MWVLARRFLFLVTIPAWLCGSVYHSGAAKAALEDRRRLCNEQYHKGISLREGKLKRSPRSWFKNLSLVNNVHRKFIPEGPKTLSLHIGKTGGESVRHVLKTMGVPFQQLHVFPAEPEMLLYFDRIIITIRDPIERYISAFNFQHPSVFKKRSHRTNMGNESLTAFGRFYDCFSNVSVLSQRFFEDSTCGRIAQHNPPWHLQMGYCYYVGGSAVRKTLREHRGVLLIRTESLTEDLARVLSVVNESSPADLRVPYLNKQGSSVSLPKELSSQELSVLRGYLERIGEYDLYNEIMRNGRNG